MLETFATFGNIFIHKNQKQRTKGGREWVLSAAGVKRRKQVCVSCSIKSGLVTTSPPENGPRGTLKPDRQRHRHQGPTTTSPAKINQFTTEVPLNVESSEKVIALDLHAEKMRFSGCRSSRFDIVAARGITRCLHVMLLCMHTCVKAVPRMYVYRPPTVL